MTKSDFPTATGSSTVNGNFGMAPPTNENEADRLLMIDELKLFLATAADHWEDPSSPLKRFALPTGESLSCVLWHDLYFVTGTDIVRSLTFRFHAFGRPITNAKKFEEGIFSDLRNLKPGSDARLEEPKSELLDMLYKNHCIRTQKKQKVFYWYSVPHDRLFLDALERDLKREKLGLEPTTTAVAEPALSTTLDTTQELFDQLRKSMSISAAASAQAFEDEVRQHFSPKGSASTSMLGAEIKATKVRRSLPVSAPASSSHGNGTPPSPASTVIGGQNRRSRVNSVPADFGQDQQLHQQLLLQQQKLQRQHYRQSHPAYFPSTSSSTSSSSLSSASQTHVDHASASSPPPTAPLLAPSEIKPEPMLPQDPLVEGVHHLDITAHHAAAPALINGVLPSKSMDSNTLKKTKTIFGALSLFDGSPTYKQRRRRATSVSSSATASAFAGGPDRVRRHGSNTHSRTPSITGSTVSNSSSSTSINSLNQTSRLAMAAMALSHKQSTYRHSHPGHARPASMCSPHAHVCHAPLQPPHHQHQQQHVESDFLSPQTWFIDDQQPMMSSTSTQLPTSTSNLFAPAPNDTLSFLHRTSPTLDSFSTMVRPPPPPPSASHHHHHSHHHPLHHHASPFACVDDPSGVAAAAAAAVAAAAHHHVAQLPLHGASPIGSDDMDDVQPSMPPSITTTTATTANAHTSPDFMLMLSPHQDDFSPSSTSSPSSMMHYGCYDVMGHPLDQQQQQQQQQQQNHHQPSTTVLLSPFKPDTFPLPPSPSQPHLQDASDLTMYTHITNVYCNTYQEYAPLTTNDMTMVFN